MLVKKNKVDEKTAMTAFSAHLLFFLVIYQQYIFGLKYFFNLQSLFSTFYFIFEVCFNQSCNLQVFFFLVLNHFLLNYFVFIVLSCFF